MCATYWATITTYLVDLALYKYQKKEEKKATSLHRLAKLVVKKIL